ncbi:farnesyl-diphosphate farnesyltransferase [Pneumocystis carinii B80]|uniref:Squalene synthase n=1 Tax=Pneumocystis carinii (strain B80) TaxID=1408658 RepID=A0A0W4ZGA5_PNEC8|nr:farnesyl-diphosphate farnesyltransferase [Pneumocystis carinii B80]KTW27422.1 farnesyl-diphosphate farnesyltransferase [Pneumocystis carinii B80]
MTTWIDYLRHPSELKEVCQYKLFYTPLYQRRPDEETLNCRECYELLIQTSRSFGRVIQELRPELRKSVMVFYLVLRGLDTIEDDMKLDSKKKNELLRMFYTHIDEKGWKFSESSLSAKDGVLLRSFDKVIEEFLLLSKENQDIIRSITYEMGNGMADFIKNAHFKTQGIQSIRDYNLYCYYVAGLVGEGLNRLFVINKIEHDLEGLTELSHTMGLFLQKTNIIRDYREDLHQQRMFWPKEVWSKYVDNFIDFLAPENQEKGLHCLSEMILDALTHVPDCLYYLCSLHDQSVFNFCAIPQSMAIATLALVFRNPNIFRKNLKIRKGEACSLIMRTTNRRNLCALFLKYIRIIHQKNTPSDPNFFKISVACGKIEQWVESVFPSDKSSVSICSQKPLREGSTDSIMDKDALYILIISSIFLTIIASLMIYLAHLFGAKWNFSQVYKIFDFLKSIFSDTLSVVKRDEM